MSDAAHDAPQKQRIDKWLFFARIVKSRTLAGKLATAGGVRIEGAKISQASHQITVGQVLTITLERQVKVLKILAAGERRGPAPEAQTLYEDLTPPAPPKEKNFSPAKIMRDAGAGRPTKKQRRDTDRIRPFFES